ncbi:hypothetical protein AE618_18760 [Bosea vaviloviae]|uniref:Uncharacterized protein n=1 Tax=Bosea vaviloviae TaxID=1526658 RepID=A0A0N1F2D3_9HYPH|nr:hypothetical protein AE618_18760 [Bosea vaviloviae]
MGFSLLLSTNARGGGEAKLVWSETANLNAEFQCGRKTPAVALEIALGRVERVGAVSPLDFSHVMGVIVGFLEGRAAR